MKKEGPPYNATPVPQDELGKDWEDVPIISTRGNSKELLTTSFYLEPHEISVSKGLYGESEAGDFQYENPAEGADEDIDETLSDENVLISSYLLSRGDNVDQIVKAISKGEGTKGRNLLLKKAQEWQEQYDNSPFGKMRERVNKMTHHLREIEAHTPESMKERHERLLKYLDDVVQPALVEQLRFQNSEIGAVDNSDELRTVARQLYDEITKFDNDLVQFRKANSIEDDSLEIEPEDKTSSTAGEGALVEGNANTPDEDLNVNIPPKVGKPVVTTLGMVVGGKPIINIAKGYGEEAKGKNERFISDEPVTPDVTEESEDSDTTTDKLSTNRLRLKNDLLSGTSLSRPFVADSMPVNSESDLDINPEYEAYGQLRQEWLEVKAEHEAKRGEYLTAVDAFYKNWADEINNKTGFIDKNWSSLRAKFGFRPDLPDEVVALLEVSNAAAEVYGQKAREMTEKRALVGKKSREAVGVTEKNGRDILERYNRRFAHEQVFNTFKAQTEAQVAAVESLGFEPGKVTSFLLRNKNAVKFAGAAAVGAIAGGLVPAGAWWLRSVVGGAAAGGTAAYTNKKLSERIDDWKLAQQEEEVRSLAAKIQDKSLSKEEIKEQQKRLAAIMAKLDAKNRAKMLTVLAAAGVSGAVVGGGAGAIGEEVFGLGANTLAEPQSRDEIIAVAEERLQKEGLGAEVQNQDTIDSRDQIIAAAEEKLAEDASEAPSEVPHDIQAATLSETASVPETVDNASEHIVEKRDTMWGYLKEMGYSDAETMMVINGLNEAQLKEVGFGIGSEIDADKVMAGATVDLEKLEQYAEGITEPDGLVSDVESTSEAGDSADKAAAGAAAPAEGGPVGTGESAVKEGADSESAASTKSQVETAAVNAASGAETGALEKSIAAAAYASVVGATAASLAAENYTTLPKKVSPDKIIDYSRAFPGGYPKFEAAFEKDFVERIQGPSHGGGLLDFLLGSKPNTTNAYQVFEAYSVADFNELATVDEVTLAKEFNENGIDMKDYYAWRDEIAAWQKHGLTIDPKDRFEDVAKTAYIRSLEQAKTA